MDFPDAGNQRGFDRFAAMAGEKAMGVSQPQQPVQDIFAALAAAVAVLPRRPCGRVPQDGQFRGGSAALLSAAAGAGTLSDIANSLIHGALLLIGIVPPMHVHQMYITAGPVASLAVN